MIGPAMEAAARRLRMLEKNAASHGDGAGRKGLRVEPWKVLKGTIKAVWGVLRRQAQRFSHSSSVQYGNPASTRALRRAWSAAW
jgi:hypothetical protein